MLPRPRPKTLLLVDDNVTNLKIAVAHLRAYSYEILTAANGEAGLQRAQLAQPDLILLDINMPGLNGLEVCRRLKANPATSAIPVIFMTARDATEDKVQGFEAGAVDYVTKPIEATELLARVQNHLALRELQLELEARVRERTAALEAEVAHRQRQQAEKDFLLELLRQQSEQLRALTQNSLEAQHQRDEGLASTLEKQASEKLATLERNLTLALQRWPDSAARQPLEQALEIARALQNLTQRVSADLHAEPTTHQQLRASPLFKLTTREYEVLHLVAQGKSNTEIAEILTIARPTVSTYRARLMQKLGLEDLPSLMKFALEHGLIS